MDREGAKSDNILFIVEGKKAEANYIKAIYEHYYPYQYVVINREKHSQILSDQGKSVIDINWIEDANVSNSLMNLKQMNIALVFQ